VTVFAPIAAAPVQTIDLRAVALSGESPVGALAGNTFHRFVDNPVIDNQGHVAFLAELGAGSLVSGVWIESDAGLRSVVQSGTPAPGTGADFAQFAELVIADGGMTAFKATLAGRTIGDDNRDSIWLDRAGTLALVARAGNKAPSTSADLRFSHFETPIALNASGQTSFFARTRDKEDETVQSSGIWASGSIGISFVANNHTEGIPGAADVVFLPQSFEQPFSNDPVISPSGQTIFRGFLSGPGIDESNLNGLWSYRETVGLQLLQRAGDDAIGLGGAHFVSFPSVPTINAAGDTALLAFFHGATEQEGAVGTGPATSTDNSASKLGLGMWLRHASGQLNHIFTIGDRAPGIEGDVHFIDTFDPVLNASSRVAFLAVVAGENVGAANEVGLWSSGMSLDGLPRLIARQGDAAPDCEPGFVFGAMLDPSLNSAGQTAFMAAGYQLVEGMIADSAFGIWGQDRNGDLRLVARVGQIVEVGPGDYREIASIVFASKTGGEDGRARGLNDLGQVAFRATFVDGSSGVFVSDVLTVPEARAGTLLFLLASCLGLKRQSQLVRHYSRCRYNRSIRVIAGNLRCTK
jgi:hypothetical protein